MASGLKLKMVVLHSGRFGEGQLACSQGLEELLEGQGSTEKGEIGSTGS